MLHTANLRMTCQKWWTDYMPDRSCENIQKENVKGLQGEGCHTNRAAACTRKAADTAQSGKSAGDWKKTRKVCHFRTRIASHTKEFRKVKVQSLQAWGLSKRLGNMRACRAANTAQSRHEEVRRALGEKWPTKFRQPLHTQIDLYDALQGEKVAAGGCRNEGSRANSAICVHAKQFMPQNSSVWEVAARRMKKTYAGVVASSKASSCAARTNRQFKIIKQNNFQGLMSYEINLYT